MSVREILLLGNPSLYTVSAEVSREELDSAREVLTDLEDTMTEFRRKYGFGRAIAASQIGAFKRLIRLKTDTLDIGFINPALEFPTDDKFEIWDDCMSFPGLEVRLLRYKVVKVRFKDLEWKDRTVVFEGDTAELIQHEYDHLDGILAVQRAIDPKSFRMNMDKAICY